MAVVARLLAHGAPVDVANSDGRTALHFAVRYSHVSRSVSNLLFVPSINVLPRRSIMALSLLVVCPRQPQVIQTLLLAGANLEHKDDMGWTPMDWAIAVIGEGVKHWREAEMRDKIATETSPEFLQFLEEQQKPKYAWPEKEKTDRIGSAGSGPLRGAPRRLPALKQHKQTKKQNNKSKSSGGGIDLQQLAFDARRAQYEADRWRPVYAWEGSPIQRQVFLLLKVRPTPAAAASRKNHCHCYYCYCTVLLPCFLLQPLCLA